MSSLQEKLERAESAAHISSKHIQDERTLEELDPGGKIRAEIERNFQQSDN